MALFAFFESGSGGLAAGQGFVDAAEGIDEALFTGKKRVALGTDINAQISDGRTDGETVAAGAGDGRLVIGRMQIRLHTGCYYNPEG